VILDAEIHSQNTSGPISVSGRKGDLANLVLSRHNGALIISFFLFFFFLNVVDDLVMISRVASFTIIPEVFIYPEYAA